MGHDLETESTVKKYLTLLDGFVFERGCVTVFSDRANE